MGQEYETVSMIRENLDDIPTYELPSSFSIKWYEPGDEKAWITIQTDADQYNTITRELFDREFNGDAELLRKRQCFLIDSNGTPIGTATAWSDSNYDGRPFGRVHWVAIIPRLQGQGLAKPLLTTVCERLRDLGHQRAYLTTAPERVAAINLYLGFGFVPEIKSIHDSNIWNGVQKKIEKRGRWVSRPTTYR